MNNGRRKCLHIWVWRWIGQGAGIDVWRARRLMWTEAGGEKEMFLYRYPSLSAHHFSASWTWHHGGPGRKAEETIGSLCGSEACGGSMSTHAVSLQFWISFPHKEMTEALAWYTIKSGCCPHASSNYTEMLFIFFYSIWHLQCSLMKGENAVKGKSKWLKFFILTHAKAENSLFISMVAINRTALIGLKQKIPYHHVDL